MKLKNKRTGEIVKFHYLQSDYISPLVLTIMRNGKPVMIKYNSLAELNAEWEDYEEPKDFWFIDPEVLIACESTEPLLCDKKVAIETMKQIGNYFDTREEAEKAVEKLKAWKRLKDKGFKFDGVYDDYTIKFTAPKEEIGWFWCNGMDKDLNLLFGGER